MADSPKMVPSANTRPTVPGTGSSGNSSRAPNTVVVESNPGNDATLTATISSWAHSLVESGQRPEITKPLSEPWEWKGTTSMGRPDPVVISASARLAPTPHDTALGRAVRKHARRGLWHATGHECQRRTKRVRGANTESAAPEK